MLALTLGLTTSTNTCNFGIEVAEVELHAEGDDAICWAWEAKAALGAEGSQPFTTRQLVGEIKEDGEADGGGGVGDGDGVGSADAEGSSSRFVQTRVGPCAMIVTPFSTAYRRDLVRLFALGRPSTKPFG